MKDLDRLVAFYENLSPEGVRHIGAFYAADAYFKDPFNEVRGVDKVQHVFAHMFKQVAEPRFRITERVNAANGAVLMWDFTFRFSSGGEMQTIRGASHLRFDEHGKVGYHCDYWDAAGELYAKVPLLGGLMRLARRRLSAGA
ncbi:MAG: nuclear transport factor 2 family protein [Betaproteobacteria bacterium]